MTKQARGPFDVKIIPDGTAEEPSIGRMRLDKQFHGALEATSKGQMVAFRTAVETSAGYVAIELVRGKLDGRSGTFVLQHSGTATKGHDQLTVTVVPDSGTGELAGLSGAMKIHIAPGGAHSYELNYTLA